MNNQFDKALRILSMTILAGTLFVSCASDGNSNSTTQEAEEKIETAKEKIGSASSDLKSAVENSEVNEEVISGDWNRSDAYDLTQVDVPPLFDASCSKASDAKKCSEEKLLAFIANNLVKPKGRKKTSLEQVLVIIDKNGALQPLKYVASGNKDGCPECQQAAIDVIGKIKNWVPAMKDGKPVASKMAIPVKFG